MEDQRVISSERGQQLADQLGVEFFETSAKENVNVKVNIFKITKILKNNKIVLYKLPYILICIWM